MRILSVLTYYDPHWTGLTAYAQRLAEGLVRRGHEVTVLASRHARELAPTERRNGVRVVRLPVAARLSRGMIMPTFPLAARRLIASHDVVQFHTPILEAWLIAALARRAGRPALMTHHGDLVMPAGLFDRLVERTVTALMIRGGRGATRVSVYTKDYADHSAFLRHFRDRLVYIYPPIEIPRPDPDATRAWKRELGLEGRPVIGFAGRFVEEKGFDFLLQALPRVRERLPEARLLFAGETNVVYERFYDRCRPLIERDPSRVVMLGLLRDRRRLAQFHAMCDVLALPSRTDAFAAVQVEAMLCGTPVVAADIPGAREAVRVTGMGRLVAPRDPAALAEGLLEVIGDRARFVKDERAVRARFDPERSVSEYETLLGALVEGRR
jgi:glycosyltransferase involved in cell wall biosynthesis